MEKQTIGKLLSVAVFGGALLLNLGVALRAIAAISEPADSAQLVTQADGQTDANTELLAEVVEYLDRPEVRARQNDRDKRLRDIELQLAAAHQKEAKERRYLDSQANAVVLGNGPDTSVFAFGQKADRVNVACESTEFGQVAIVSTSAAPKVFFKARYLRSCEPGQYSPGDEIGLTVAELSWSQHNQASGGAVEPNREYLEWALSGYAGEYAAPMAQGVELDVGAIAQNVKSFFDEP
jgi:hypothetical protein